MRISFVPRYTEAAASSRLRVFALAAALSRLGLADTVTQFDTGADVIVLQKSDDPRVFDAAFSHPRVIYDYDDVWSDAALTHAAYVARVFTTDTPGHASLSLPMRGMRGIACEILPDPIDYGGNMRHPAEPFALAWFGNYPNYESARPLFETAQKYTYLGTIADRQVSPVAHPIAWSYHEFPASLRRFGTAFLSHRGADPGKSANKMVAAVALGVPCIVNESPAYEELARAVGIDWAIVRTPEELHAAYVRLQDPRERKDYLAAIQPYVLEHYHADAVARRFMQIVEGLA